MMALNLTFQPDIEICRIAIPMILAGFPRRPINEDRFFQQAVGVDGSTISVNMTTVASVFPFGHDRFLLRWMVDRALQTGDRLLGWEDILSYCGRNPGREQIEALRQSVDRISSILASITITERRNRVQTICLAIASQRRWPKDSHPLRPGEQYWVEFSSEFLEFVSTLDWKQLRAESRKRSRAPRKQGTVLEINSFSHVQQKQ